MIIFWPRRVTFGAETWDGVVAVSIDRVGVRAVVEWSDYGPHPIFADSPELRTTITVSMEIMRGVVASPRPGQVAMLTVDISPNTSQSQVRRVTAQAVVVRVTHDLTVKKGAVRTIELLAVSSDGAADPITETLIHGMEPK